VARSRIVDLANFQQFTAINVLADGGHDPTPKPIPNGIHVTLVWNIADGKLAHNVLGASVAGAFAPTTTIANSILTSLTTGANWTTLAGFIANTAALTAVQLRDLRSLDQPIIPSSSPGANGTSASPELPNEVALVTTLRTALTGPGNRGRFYTPGWATNALATGNVAAPAVVTALNAWAQTIFTVFSGQAMTWGLIQPSRISYTGTTGKVHPARAPGVLPITTATVRDNHWDSQRRRGLK